MVKEGFRVEFPAGLINVGGGGRGKIPRTTERLLNDLMGFDMSCTN